MSTDQNALRDVFTGFYAWGDFVSAEPYGTGHINDTYRVQTSLAGTPVHYLMQRINHDIFKQPDGVMDNIVRVTHHLRAKMAGAPDASRRALTVIPARVDGRPWVRDRIGNWWRLYLFIERARTYDVIEDARQAFEAARAFARFQNLLADLPAPRLNSESASSRAPETLSNVTRASSAASGESVSAATAALQTLPPMVAAFRICCAPTLALASASIAAAERMTGECATLSCVAIAPMETSPFSSVMARSSERAVRSSA